MTMQIHKGVMVRLTPRKPGPKPKDHRVLSTCPSEVHNTSGAARGASRCTCPHALSLRPVLNPRLPGNGPWRILTQCPSRGHNTLLSTEKSPRCICPRALALRPIVKSPLPGGGPWALAPYCSAKYHNTESSAIGNNHGTLGKDKVRCVCPRALALRDAGLEKMVERSRQWARDSRARRIPQSAAALEKRIAAVPAPPAPLIGPMMPLWWSGPWRIADECRAEGHHAVARALGRGGRTPCTCPRALIVLKKYRENSHSSKRTRKLPTASTTAIKAIDLPDVGKRPDLSRGRCVTSVRGPEVFDRAMEAGMGQGPAAQRARARARAYCETCPVLRECRSWTLRGPLDPGAGVVGGLDTKQRMVAMNRIREESL